MPDILAVIDLTRIFTSKYSQVKNRKYTVAALYFEIKGRD